MGSYFLLIFIQLLKADSSLVKNVPSSLGSEISGKLCEKLVKTMEFTMLCTMAFPWICFWPLRQGQHLLSLI
jgi:hypothetical protein